MRLKSGTNCKYCGKLYKYGAWLSRHEYKHWWNEVATPEEKEILREHKRKHENMILFGVKRQPNICSGIQNWIH